jgi:3-oxoacyl-[acyl-carrier-protein] synthase III
VTGEKLSSIIKLHPENKKDLSKRLACLSMGDGGAAMVLERSSDNAGIYAHRFETYGDHWHLCTVPGGGSMFPHDGSKVYFEGKTKELRDIFMKKKGRIAEECLAQAGWAMEEIDHFFMHHVSTSTFGLVADSFGADPEKFFSVIEHYGNMAATSIPFAMCKAIESGKLKKGDKIMLIGLASGISISIQLIIW